MNTTELTIIWVTLVIIVVCFLIITISIMLINDTRFNNLKPQINLEDNDDNLTLNNYPI
jgi:YbbR domain-containing protein